MSQFIFTDDYYHTMKSFFTLTCVRKYLIALFFMY